jgi:hypothetical protein
MNSGRGGRYEEHSPVESADRQELHAPGAFDRRHPNFL